MVSSRLLFLLSPILMLIIHANEQPAFRGYLCDNNNGNYTSNSIYEKNLNQLLPTLYSNTTIDYGFYYSTYGQNSDQVYAIGLCRGDVNPDDCRGCLNISSTLLTQTCPNQKDAIGAYGHRCMLRYSNSSIYGIMEISPFITLWNVEKVAANSVGQFNDDLNSLLSNLTNEAAAGSSLLKYAARGGTRDFLPLYALVQCTPDLSQQNCINCLLVAIKVVPQCCNGTQGGRVIVPSCNLRFEQYSFFDSTTGPSSTNTTTSSPSTNVTNSKGIHAIMPITYCICGR